MQRVAIATITALGVLVLLSNLDLSLEVFLPLRLPQPTQPPAPSLFLFDWEQAAAADQVCKPPPGTPERCCPGASSSRDQHAVSWAKSQRHCQNKLSDYQALPYDYDPSSASKILHYLDATSSTLAFAGDSLMAQFAVGFECEFLRRGFRILQQSNDDRELPKGQDGLEKVQEWVVGGESLSATGAKVLHFAQNRYDKSWAGMVEILERADVVVMNFGLGWEGAPTAEYRDDMTALFEFLRRQAASGGKTLVWRETFAQHPDSPQLSLTATSQCGEVEYSSKFPHMCVQPHPKTRTATARLTCPCARFARRSLRSLAGTWT
jgi:hypothetical protein